MPSHMISSHVGLPGGRAPRLSFATVASRDVVSKQFVVLTTVAVAGPRDSFSLQASSVYNQRLDRVLTMCNSHHLTNIKTTAVASLHGELVLLSTTWLTGTHTTHVIQFCPCVKGALGHSMDSHGYHQHYMYLITYLLNTMFGIVPEESIFDWSPFV